MKAYIAHPFDYKDEIRAWELRLESEIEELDLVNPFYDITRKDIDEINAGRAGRYEKLDPVELVLRDVKAIEDAGGIIAYIPENRKFQCGTFMEIVYAYKLGVPVYIVCTNGHHDHPWLKFHANEIFTSLEDLEDWIKKAMYLQYR